MSNAQDKTREQLIKSGNSMYRHSGESQNPVKTIQDWMLAFASMTKKTLNQSFPGYKFIKGSCGLFLVCCFIAPLSFAEDKAVIAGTDDQALLNAIHSDELKKIMRRLDMLAYENEYTELELQSMRVSQVNRLLEFTDELLIKADNLPQITDTELSESDKITFKAMARQLYTDTLNLEASAADKNYSNMGKRYLELRKTCGSCHRLFRAFQ